MIDYLKEKAETAAGVAVSLWEWARQDTKHFLYTLVGVTVFVVGGYDIITGRSAHDPGHVLGHTTRLECETVCDSKDKDGNCSSSHTECETIPVLIVKHEQWDEEQRVCRVDVSWYTYARHADGAPVTISCWEGGFIGVHWFETVGDPK